MMEIFFKNEHGSLLLGALALILAVRNAVILWSHLKIIKTALEWQASIAKACVNANNLNSCPVDSVMCEILKNVPDTKPVLYNTRWWVMLIGTITRKKDTKNTKIQEQELSNLKHD